MHKECIGEVDPVSYDDIDEVNVYSFEQDGRIWCFTKETMLNLFNQQSLYNPMTRRPLPENVIEDIKWLAHGIRIPLNFLVDDGVMKFSYLPNTRIGDVIIDFHKVTGSLDSLGKLQMDLYNYNLTDKLGDIFPNVTSTRIDENGEEEILNPVEVRNADIVQTGNNKHSIAIYAYNNNIPFVFNFIDEKYLNNPLDYKIPNKPYLKVIRDIALQIQDKSDLYITLVIVPAVNQIIIDAKFAEELVDILRNVEDVDLDSLISILNLRVTDPWNYTSPDFEQYKQDRWNVRFPVIPTNRVLNFD